MAGAVLIVDDDPVLARSIREALRGKDVIIETATDAATACTMLEQGRFCGLVLDIILADGNGFDVLACLERKHLDIPTIVVTQNLPSYVREMLHADRVKLVFPKPVEARLLGAIVLGLCGLET